jgi:hypothetical protein
MERIRLGNEDTCIICETKGSSQEQMWAGTCLGGFHFCCHYSYVSGYSDSYGPCRDALHKSIELNKAYVGQINANMTLTEEGVIKIINDARTIYKNNGKFDVKLLEHQVDSLLRPVKKDPYKEHREKLEKDPHFRQYLLDEHKCELCGNKGNSISKNSHINSYLNEKQQQFLHIYCEHIIANFAIVKGISLKESFDKLKPLFEKKQQAGDKKKECRILGSLDLIGNPWNR